MSKQYDKLMDHIQVTPEMAERILEKLENVQRRKKPSRYWVTGLAAAACMLLLISSPIFRPEPRPIVQTSQIPSNVQTSSRLVPADSPEQLSQLVGFPIPSIPELPFEIEEIVYNSYWNKMAEITCTGSGNIAVLRMTPGTEDCSGDYAEYAVQRKLDVQDLSISLKGQEEEVFHLAVWSDGKFSYSIKMNKGISAEKWEEILLSFRKA